ncbi:Protein of unknown function [Saccharicrinis carchari]|uniref:DUF3307 domain-containing protein n=1 Tax=Saccharicrinis carchari TaxID=1168039 RepID=A0A521CG62_SACCC|nr:DUF3307 domain-containing protein [Saccharicrinis carchari]SMO57771.1 Protein of unknown function [Saccharicrinis carchari]
MIPKLILLQVTAHLLADYLLQPQRWSNLKRQKVVTVHHIYHAMVVFACSFILSFDVQFWSAALAITILHFGTDVLKSYLQIQAKRANKTINYFFYDQLMHLLILTTISVLYLNFCPQSYYLNIPYNVVLIVFGFVLLSKPTNICMKNIFMVFKIETPIDDTEHEITNEKSLPNAGKLIGIMERYLVFSLILVSQYAAVGLIIAAKSILRYKSSYKNEYILVGTLLSFGIATMLGVFAASIL